MEKLLEVKVILPEGVGVETSLIIRSLQAELEKAIREDENFRVTSPSPALTTQD